MEILIPVKDVKVYNSNTCKDFCLNTTSPEELKDDDFVLIDEKMLLESFEEQLENQDVSNTFVKKLLKAIAYDEDLQNEIISIGIDLATKCTEDPERALFVAAKKMWASINRGY